MRSCTNFFIKVGFMLEKDKVELADQICQISPYWLELNHIYQFGCQEIGRYEAGINLDEAKQIILVASKYILKKYPAVNTCGFCIYNQMNSEGTFSWSYEIKNGICYYTDIEAPLDTPTNCDECEEWLEFNLIDYAKDPDNYKCICPECGKQIDLNKYKIKVFKYTNK